MAATLSASAHERVGLDPTTPWWGEHRARYRFAAPFAPGRVVLDAACGSGFGVDMLASSHARTVVGIDIAPAPLQAARAVPASFVCADVTRLPFATGTFELCTSFETIEHLVEPDRFIAELHRVTAPGGLLFLSTPNALVTARYTRNPFHVREFESAELLDLLSRRFSKVLLYGQMPRAEFGVLPFLPGHEVARSVREHCQSAGWKLLNRCAAPVRDTVARRLFGRPFHPGESDYWFDATAVETAHVILAVCRRS